MNWESEVFYKSEDGHWRVVYNRDDLGKKYKLQKWLEDCWRWQFMDAYESPLAALTAMKRAAKEW